MHTSSEAVALEELPLLGETFAVELANSHYIGDGEDLDFLTDPLAAATWFSAADAARDLVLPATLAPAVLAGLREVRDATRAVLAEVADTDGVVEPESSSWRAAAETLHRHARRAPAHLALTLDRTPTWQLHHTGTDAKVLIAAAATRCILFLGGDQAARVRRCDRPACPMLFVRHHASRRFCTEACAHTVRQARYYRRTRSSAATQPDPSDPRSAGAPTPSTGEKTSSRTRRQP